MPRLALGTAQLGLDYGVANRAGRPARREIERMLGAALTLGVEYIDTAQAYGDAETLIGGFLRRHGRPERLRIGTKLQRLGSGLSAAGLAREVARAVDRSRARIGVDCLDDLLLHSAENLREYGVTLTAVLARQREEGRVGRVGVSVYQPDECDLALSHDTLAATQLPFSVFDQGCGRSGAVARLRAAGHEVFARSALHQGLLVLSPGKGEAAVPGAGRWLARFQEICLTHGVEPAAAAFGFAARRSGADYVVVGVDSVEQLTRAATLVHGPVPVSLLADLERAFSDVPSAVKDPRLWPGAT